jgi:hypothetical protein
LTTTIRGLDATASKTPEYGKVSAKTGSGGKSHDPDRVFLIELVICKFGLAIENPEEDS